MRKKIRIMLVIVVLLFYSMNINALTKNEMISLNLKNVAKYPIGNSHVQGGVATDEYVISVLLNNNTNSNSLLVLNKDTFKRVNVGNSSYHFGHGNDATYNKDINQIYVIDGKNIHVLDAKTLKLKSNISLKTGHNYHAIGYDELTNQYVLAYSANRKTIFDIMDSNFNLIRSFSIDINMTRQALTVKDGIIYYCAYEAGSITKYQSYYDGALKHGENALFVYDLDGNKKDIYYINKLGELENASFVNDHLLLQFHIGGNVTYYISTNLKKYNYVSEPNNYLDDNNLTSKSNVIIDSTQNLNQVPTNNSSSNDSVQEVDSIEFTAFDNMISDEKNGEISAINNMGNSTDTQIVDVPDTRNDTYLYLVGIIIIINLIFYIRKINLN